MKDKKNLIIYGARKDGHGKMVASCVDKGKYNLLGFIDDMQKPPGNILGYPLLGNSSYLLELNKKEKLFVIPAVGDNNGRLKIFNWLLDNNIPLGSVIHKTAIIADNVKIGEGVFIAPGVIINSGGIIGDNVIINTGSVLEHDNKIGQNVFIGPNVTTCGRVELSNNAFVGAGAVLLPDVVIGNNSCVGAGCVVISDIKNSCKVVGNPHKYI